MTEKAKWITKAMRKRKVRSQVLFVTTITYTIFDVNKSRDIAVRDKYKITNIDNHLELFFVSVNRLTPHTSRIRIAFEVNKNSEMEIYTLIVFVFRLLNFWYTRKEEKYNSKNQINASTPNERLATNENIFFGSKMFLNALTAQLQWQLFIANTRFEMQRQMFCGSNKWFDEQKRWCGNSQAAIVNTRPKTETK